jgi:hypothetical protein
VVSGDQQLAANGFNRFRNLLNAVPALQPL